MEILVIASLITAFIAGLAALFAPCCIGVLLPTYFASIFRQRKTVLLMTSVFFLGLLAVFLPLGLGFGFLGELFKEYHNTIYILGSIFLFVLGISILFGYHFSVPFHMKSNNKITGAKSIFLMGIFSGFATLCCAPVLAGAMALSVLPGSVLWGGIYSIAYVLGMVSPLFLISYFIDKTKIVEKMNIFKKEIKYEIFGRKINLTTSDLVSGIIFVVMSTIILYSVMTNKVAVHSSTQTDINIVAAQITDFIISKIEIFLMLFVLVLFLSIYKIVISRKLKHK